MRTKYKGHHNSNTQIRGTFSAGGEFLVCGSDDGWAYVWPSDAAPGAGSVAGKRVRSNDNYKIMIIIHEHKPRHSRHEVLLSFESVGPWCWLAGSLLRP